MATLDQWSLKLRARDSGEGTCSCRFEGSCVNDGRDGVCVERDCAHGTSLKRDPPQGDPRLPYPFRTGRVVTRGTPPRMEGCRPANRGLALALVTCKKAKARPGDDPKLKGFVKRFVTRKAKCPFSRRKNGGYPQKWASAVENSGIRRPAGPQAWVCRRSSSPGFSRFRTSECRMELVARALPPNGPSSPSKEVKRPPASVTMGTSAAMS